MPIRVESTGPRSKKAISFGCAASVQSKTEMPPWYHACTITSRPGIGISEPLCATQFSCRRLRRGQLVVALELQSCRSTIVKIASAPHSFGSVARHLGCAAAAPLVGEQDLGAVVVERRRVPVGEVGVGHGVEAHRMRRIADVEQEAVALARAAGETDRRIDRDVVALGRARRGPSGRASLRRSSWRSIAGSAARSAALSAAVGAPVPPRALTMLSSIGLREPRREHHLRAHGSSPMNAPLRLAPRRPPWHSAAMSSGASPCRGGAIEVVEDARRAHDRRLLRDAPAAP